MKKNIFIILISTLFILFLIYFYDKRELVLNKEYKDYENHIYVEYPYFNDFVIDNYLNDYLNRYIQYYYGTLGDLLFIDYDYMEDDDELELTIYIYEENGNMIHKEEEQFEVDVINSSISKKNGIIDASFEYDAYQQKVIDTERPMVAFTFDDGPNHNTNKVLDILEKYGVKATFFILGTNIKENEGIIQRMDQLGMEIGNHMYSHKLITRLSDSSIKEEVKKVDTMIFDVIGKYPTLVRPSYGTFNKRIKKLMDKPIIIWDVDTLDWKYHNSKRISDKVIKQVKDGDIILMHDIYSATANSLTKIIPKLLNDGYQLVTVSELFYYKGISMVAGNVYSNAK